MEFTKEDITPEVALMFDIEMKATIAIARNESIISKGGTPEPYDELLKNIAESGEISEDEIPAILKRIEEMESEKNS